MMDTGIDQILRIQREQAERSRARAASDLWRQLHSLLRSVPGRGVAGHLEFCNRLELTPAADRAELIRSEYGATCLDRAAPLLYQLESVGA